MIKITLCRPGCYDTELRLGIQLSVLEGMNPTSPKNGYVRKTGSAQATSISGSQNIPKSTK